MNTYRIYSSQKLFYVTKIEADSEQEAFEKFWDADLDDVDEYGVIEIDNIDLIEKGESK